MNDTPLPNHDDTETPSIQDVKKCADPQPRAIDEDESPRIPGIVPVVPQPNEAEATHDDHIQ
ncbi:hypothetical protein H0H92_002337, partial [Tricholoma furcatifolium]